jgi:hypothetical protein
MPYGYRYAYVMRRLWWRYSGEGAFAKLAGCVEDLLRRSKREGRALGRSFQTLVIVEPLRAGRSVLDFVSLAQGIHHLVDGQKRCGFERTKGTPATDRHRNCGCMLSPLALLFLLCQKAPASDCLPLGEDYRRSSA